MENDDAVPLRSADGAEAIEFTMPDLGVGQVVVSVDEAGAVRWHFPLNADLTIRAAAQAGGGALKTFRIRW